MRRRRLQWPLALQCATGNWLVHCVGAWLQACLGTGRAQWAVRSAVGGCGLPTRSRQLVGKEGCGPPVRNNHWGQHVGLVHRPCAAGSWLAQGIAPLPCAQGSSLCRVRVRSRAGLDTGHLGHSVAWSQAGLVTGRLGHRPAWSQAGLVTDRLGHRLAWSPLAWLNAKRAFPYRVP